MKRLAYILVAISLMVGLVCIAGCGGGTATSPPLSPEEAAAVQGYANDIIGKLDTLYEKFERGELHAKKISDEGQAPYNMAIGYMAELRKTADEIQVLPTPKGAENIKEITLNKLQDLQDRLDEIASKGASDVSLTDPQKFYTAYLDVLIEIPKLKQDILKMSQQ